MSEGTRPICYRCQGLTGGCNGSCRIPDPGLYRMGHAEPAKGCICPPGSEKTCERWDCGRKGIKVSVR